LTFKLKGGYNQSGGGPV